MSILTRNVVMMLTLVAIHLSARTGVFSLNDVVASGVAVGIIVLAALVIIELIVTRERERRTP